MNPEACCSSSCCYSSLQRIVRNYSRLSSLAIRILSKLLPSFSCHNDGSFLKSPRPSLPLKRDGVILEKNSLILRKSRWVKRKPLHNQLRNDAIKKHHFASFGTISHDMFYLASLPNKIIVSLHCHSERMNLVHSSNTLTKI